FNVTNLSNIDLNSLELSISTNEYGFIMNPTISTRSSLNQDESWLSEEYIIDLISSSTVVSKPLDLAIILDQSGSMGDEISVLTDDLVGVINQISDEVNDLQIGLILFGGSSSNPYNDDSLVTPLTEDISTIVDVLSSTVAGGGHEPWGDALWVAQNRLNWREGAVKLIVLITDEPCDGGNVIGYGGTDDYDGELLYELFASLESQGFILCTVAASGADALTLRQLEIAAETTAGTFIILGGDGPQTSDIPDIIGELVVKYAVELDLKIDVSLSHLNHEDIREYRELTFIVLIDDLPPEIDTWEYFSEDFFTDEKIVNVLFEIKDVTGVPFVEIYYKFSNVSFWTTTNATHIANDTFLLSLIFTEYEEQLSYQVYTEDWLGNDILSEIYTIDLLSAEESSRLYVGKKRELVLVPYQQITLKLIGAEDEELRGIEENSTAIVFSETNVGFDILAADIDESIIIVDQDNCTITSFNIEPQHTVKVSFVSSEYVEIHVVNVLKGTLEFKQEINRFLGVEDVFLYELDNRINETRERSIVADSQQVQTSILVFDAETWELLVKGSSEVVLPNITCYVLIFATYHTGDVFITFTYDDLYDPWGHYYGLTSAYWPFFAAILGIASIIILRKKQRK
ncbi:MAG: VWA domain-containing protein, partial [Candidatus Heimdallarchaeota archaeon]|nr:VWA domain-containing protein [Candidatus Heimdallarchaeota archaeon]